MGCSADNKLGRAQQHQDAAMLVTSQQILPSSQQSLAQEGLGARLRGTAGELQGSWRAHEPEIAAGPWRQGGLEAHPQ